MDYKVFSTTPHATPTHIARMFSVAPTCHLSLPSLRCLRTLRNVTPDLAVVAYMQIQSGRYGSSWSPETFQLALDGTLAGRALDLHGVHAHPVRDCQALDPGHAVGPERTSAASRSPQLACAPLTAASAAARGQGCPVGVRPIGPACGLARMKTRRPGTPCVSTRAIWKQWRPWDFTFPAKATIWRPVNWTSHAKAACTVSTSTPSGR